MERVRGIEPPSQAWEARVLPLNYTRTMDRSAQKLGARAAKIKRPAGRGAPVDPIAGRRRPP